ncbi:hypothetical protein Pfo_004455 [Paulownia fortunei]|nr:hypothetical protein Pfo_004455 [Paulownia fortunei]
MENSADATSGKCYSGILRRLLCSGSLPTHPSDQFMESNIKGIGDQKPEKSLEPEANVKQAAASTPGVVARLMGLDSFPNTPLAQKDRSLGSFFRSRSVNSIDFLSHFDPIKQGHHQHRRVRTSVSFREGINEDYTSVLVPHLEEVNETAEDEEELLIRKRPNVNYQQGKKEKGARSKNSEILQEKKITNKPSKKLEIVEQRRSVCVKLSSGVGNATSQKKDFQTRQSLRERMPIIKSVNSTEELIGSKSVKKKKNKILSQKVHSGCSLKKVHPEGTVPEVAGEVGSRHLPSQIANSQSPFSSGAHYDNGEVRAIIKGKNERKMKNKESCYYKRMVEEICRVTEEDVKENWMHGLVLKFEDFEEICRQFGQEILEVLLKQFVDELVLLYGTWNKY